MQCAKFEKRLQQLLDDRQNVEQDEVLREHSRGCVACGRIWRAQSLLFAGLKSLPESSCDQDLGPRVLDQLRTDQRKRDSRRLWIAALATAAVIMVAMLPLAGDRVRFQQNEDVGGGGLALALPAPQQPPESQLSEQESEEIRTLMHQMMLRLSEQRLSMFEPVDQLNSGIRPLTITFNFALDTLRRTLPGYSQPQPVEPQALLRGERSLMS